MPTYKFHLGEAVYVKPVFSRNFPGGSYEVTKKLPENQGEPEYRIENVSEAHERVVRESELAKAR
jgi:hypothetical protein